MQLKRLEIKGFKSFVDKEYILFDEGVTGIVGPNGCGKSNVVDAIRWVLGEQKSRILRSDKMENIIFNGTKNRKPAPVAEVSLWFLNNKEILPSEYSEVTIMRRYHRTGESEYFLNNVSCRLKDINNLFLDTGIGSDSYSIIELKMVEELLADRENSRRSLFEKAAGVSKYKIRKREVMSRLESVDSDIARIDDLLLEIQKNLKSLEKQAKQADKYFELKGFYKQNSIALAQKSFSRQNAQMLLIQERIEQETDVRLQLMATMEDLESKSEDNKKDMLESETDFYDQQKNYNEHLNQIRHTENERKIKVERLAYLQSRINSLKVQIQLDQESTLQNEQVLEELKVKKSDAAKEFETVQKKLDNEKTLLNQQKEISSTLFEQVQILQSSIRQQEQKIFQLGKEIDIKQSRVFNLEQEIDNLDTDRRRHLKTLEDLEKEVYSVEQLYEELKNRLSTLQEEEKTNRENIQIVEIGIEENRQSLILSNRLYDSKKNEYELNQNIIDSLEGFEGSLQFLKRNQNLWTDTEAPLLVEILEFEKPEIRYAVENLLDLNFFVVETEEIALKAIKLLKEAKAGSAGFWILEKITPTQSELLMSSGNKKIRDHIKADAKYDNLINFLLENVWISEESSNKEDTIVSIVDEEIIIKKAGFIKGGSQTNSAINTHQSRIQKNKDLAKEIGAAKKEMDNVQSRLNAQIEYLQTLKKASLSESIVQVQSHFNTVNSSFATLKSKQEQLHQLVDAGEQKKTETTHKKEQLIGQIEEINQMIVQENNVIKEFEEKFQERKNQQEEQEKTLEQQKNNFNEQNIVFHQFKSQLDNITNEENLRSQNLEQLIQRIDQQVVEQEQASKTILDLQAQIEWTNEQLEVFNQKTDFLKEVVQTSEKKYYQLRGLINEIEQSGKEFQKQKDRQDEIIKQFQNKLHEEQLGLTAMQERMMTEFEIDMETILNTVIEIDESIQEDELRIQVAEFKRQIEKLGVINPMAMETYNENKERFDFIEVQKKDLLESKQSLLKTMKEMESFAQEAFMKAFEKIRENFVSVFRSLFTDDDTADLVLTDPENPLDSKIEIIAKPKGKRPLTIAQLSGGEKTLTATSLLFAIYLLKPAPFCIFDEVDAPLDDANTDKFNQIIKNFSKDSQFIIVTHNKRTMETTDVLYGITMLEQGVSRVVPVDLRNLAG